MVPWPSYIDCCLLYQLHSCNLLAQQCERAFLPQEKVPLTLRICHCCLQFPGLSLPLLGLPRTLHPVISGATATKATATKRTVSTPSKLTSRLKLVFA